MAKLEVVRAERVVRVGNIRNFTAEQYENAIENGAVYVGRPTYWGNRFSMKDARNDQQRNEVLRRWWDWVCLPEQKSYRNEIRAELKGRDLICWCAPKKCHAHGLVKIAMSPVEK